MDTITCGCGTCPFCKVHKALQKITDSSPFRERYLSDSDPDSASPSHAPSWAELDNLQAEYEELQAENEELRAENEELRGERDKYRLDYMLVQANDADWKNAAEASARTIAKLKFELAKLK